MSASVRSANAVSITNVAPMMATSWPACWRALCPRDAAGLLTITETGIDDTTYLHPIMWHSQYQFDGDQLCLLASTDVALRVLMLLAREPAGHHLNVEVLARELGGLSRNHLHKIVQDLTALGVTRAVRGAGSSVMLAVRPGKAMIGTLVRQLEAEQAAAECFRSDGCA
jgi:Rrf2 family transcriptional regulator, nitric oxide-sensitive transcriptional repressor